jgi:hypothetical protein
LPEFIDEISKGCFVHDIDSFEQIEKERSALIEKEMPGFTDRSGNFEKVWFDQTV